MRKGEEVSVSTALDNAAVGLPRPTPSAAGCSTDSPQSIAERGYRDTTVADVVRHAKTSKRTFYDQFASKEDCFIELLRSNNEEMIAASVAAVDPEADWHGADPPGRRRLRRPHRGRGPRSR